MPWGAPYLVISHDYWQRRFHGDPPSSASACRFGRHALTIVGVARKGFFGVEPGKFVDIWIPAMMYSKASFTELGWNWFRILGRLGPRSNVTEVCRRASNRFSAA